MSRDTKISVVLKGVNQKEFERGNKNFELSYMHIRLFEEQVDRVETGPIQFGNDWPGTFIRGDDSLQYAYVLRSVLNQMEKMPDFSLRDTCILQNLCNDLRRCAIGRKYRMLDSQ